MRKDLITFKKINSSFFSCDQDISITLELLFSNTNPYSEYLRRLLFINNPDCLKGKTDQIEQKYKKIMSSKVNLAYLEDNDYIRQNPKIQRGENESIKSYIIVTQDNFVPNKTNPAYRDYDLNFDIVCYNDEWVLDGRKTRPLMIVGYIDGILNSLSDPRSQGFNSFQSHMKLTGIGEYQLNYCKLVVLNEQMSMYSLSYHGVHSSEDLGEIPKVGG